MNIILGNGVSAYIIAACLSYLNEDFIIYGDLKYDPHIPDILLMNVNKNELEHYLLVLNDTDKRNICSVKVGYWYDGSIHSNVSDDARFCYFDKQNRKECRTSLSDGKNNFLAIDLKNIITNLIKKYVVNDIHGYTYDENDTIYDTMNYYNINVNERKMYEYISKNDYFDVLDYNYVYDCSNNNIKRYTKDYIEYLEAPQKSYKKIINYYDEPKIYMHNNIILLGRYATKTQIKQKDIIDYLIDCTGVIENV